ncbi:MAG: hypothetical protein AMXMBFR64_18500 [Myxococcales bacterium]
MRVASAGPAMPLLVALTLGLSAAAALFLGVQSSVRWTVYLLFVPLTFLALFMSRSSAVRAFALFVPFLLLEDTVIAYRQVLGVGISVSQPVALVVLASVALRDRTFPRLGRYGVLWLLLFAIGIVAMVPSWGSADFALAVDRFRRSYLEALVYFVLGIAIARTPLDARRLLWVFIGVGGVFAALHFQFVLTGEEFLTPPKSEADPMLHWRYASPLGNPNNLACYYAMFMPGALLIGVTERRRLVSLVAFAVAVAMAGSLVLTASRGGLLATGFSLLLMIALLGQGARGRGRVLPVLLTALIAAYLLLTTVFADQLTQSVERYQERGLEDVRTELWRHTIGIIAENPFGLGLAHTHYMEALTSRTLGFLYASPHNIYLEFLTSIGVQGFLVVVLLLGRVIRAGMRALPIAGRTNRVTLASLLTAMMAMLAAGMTEPVYFTGVKLNHVFYGVVGGLVGLVAWLEAAAPSVTAVPASPPAAPPT